MRSARRQGSSPYPAGSDPGRGAPTPGSGLLRGVFLCLTVLLASPLVAADFSACAEAFQARPEDYESAYCFYDAAQAERSWPQAAEALGVLLEEYPRNHWPRLVLGHVLWRFDPSRTEETYRRAADGFRQEGVESGEVLSRVNLYAFLVRRGDLDLAEREVEQVAGIASSSEDPVIAARSLVLEAQHLRNRGHDLEAAYRLLRQAEPLIFPLGPYRLRRQALNLLGSVSHRLGRYSQAMRFYERLEALAREEGDAYAAALFAYNQANTMLASEFELPTPGGREKLIQRFREALAAAQETGHRSAEVLTHRGLGDLLSPFLETRRLAEDHYENCTELSRAMRRPGRISLCLAAHGRHLARWGETARADRLLEESLKLAHDAEDTELALRIREKRMVAGWSRGGRERSIEEAQKTLDALEAFRDGQQASSGRAGVLAAWSDLYYWPSGRWLEGDGDEPSRQEIELAFRFTERLRARVLLESKASSRAAAFDIDGDAWKPVLADLVRVQRRLLTSSLDEASRRRVLRELERAEMNEAEVWRHVEGSKAEVGAFASLTDVENALSADEALLSFQVALWRDIYGDFGGGSWLLVSTSGGTRAYRLPDRAALRPAIRLFNGLIEGRDGAEMGASVRLYESLLKEALDDLPPGVERLMITPDDDLHRLPFSTLRSGLGARPLAERFRLSRIPSATLWLRWRQNETGSHAGDSGRRGEDPRPGRVLALADPEPAFQLAQSADSAPERDWALASGAPLGALPHARREGRRILDRLGAGSHLLVGPEATESYVKGPELGRYGMLHFAAHAVIDADHPQRSAVLLSPGTPEEDGLLQPRDIAQLDLTDKVVVLSACQGSSGAMLRGEGVLSLARAFFAAGSSAVIGSLWKLRDDEASRLFDRFYLHIAEGESVEAALAEAQADLIREGLPAAAWAGLSVLGDGHVVPFPGGRMDPATSEKTPWPLILLVGLFLGLGLAAVSSSLKRRT